MPGGEYASGLYTFCNMDKGTNKGLELSLADTFSTNIFVDDLEGSTDLFLWDGWGHIHGFYLYSQPSHRLSRGLGLVKFFEEGFYPASMLRRVGMGSLEPIQFGTPVDLTLSFMRAYWASRMMRPGAGCGLVWFLWCAKTCGSVSISVLYLSLVHISSISLN